MEETSESTRGPLEVLTSEQLEEGQFICPNCGGHDFEFFEDAYIMKVSQKEFEKLSDEQKLYVNEKYEYGVLLCDNCLDKTKRNARIIKCLYILALILLYVNFAITLLIIPVIIYFESTKLPRKFNFEQAWKCGAVRRISS